MNAEEIEARSFEAIDRAVPSHEWLTEDQWQIARRMVHTTGDPTILQDLRFSRNAISHAIDALRTGSPVYVDSNMARAGLSMERLRSVYPGYSPKSVICHIADQDIKKEACEAGLPRSLFAVRKAKPILHGSIAVFGNSPVGLLELDRLILEEKILPRVVIAMPVGFVHVIESKEEVMSLDVPYIALRGHRGGSPLAVSVIHALCSLAASSVRNGGCENV